MLPYQKKGSNQTPEDILPLIWDKKEDPAEAVLTQAETRKQLENQSKFWKEQDKKIKKIDS